MLLLLSLLAQATAPEAVAQTQVAVPPKRCVAQPDDSGEIVVCGRVDQEAFRIRPLPDRYHPNKGPGIGFMLGDVAGNVYADQTRTIDGKPDKRIMVTLRKPF